MGLDPGDSYSVELGTKTGNVSTRQAISEHVMTRPLPVEGLVPIDVTPGVQFNRIFCPRIYSRTCPNSCYKF